MIGLGLAVSLTVIVARFVWIFPWTYLPFRFSAKWRATMFRPPPASVFVVGWAGMRGAVSLAAALSLPLETAAVPRARPADLPDVLRHPRHARRPGADAALDRRAARAGGRPRHRARGGDGAPGRHRCRAGAARRSRPRVPRPPRTRRPAPVALRRTRPSTPREDLAIGDAERELLEHQAIRAAVIEVQRESIIRSARRRGRSATWRCVGSSGTSTSRSSGRAPEDRGGPGPVVGSARRSDQREDPLAA